MKHISTKKIIFLMVAVLILSACNQSISTVPPVTPTSVSPALTEQGAYVVAEGTKTIVPTETLTPTIVPTQGSVVVTATGMVDLGPLLNIPTEKSNDNPIIEWDQYLKSEQWDEQPCLYDPNLDCYYAQTSVDGSFYLNDFAELPFSVPNAYYMIAGTYEGSLELESGFSKSHTRGFLFALSPNTIVKSLYLKDGFMSIVPASIAREEFCARLQQAVDHEWARDWNYGDDTWGEDPCNGLKIVVPLDSDRIP